MPDQSDPAGRLDHAHSPDAILGQGSEGQMISALQVVSTAQLKAVNRLIWREQFRKPPEPQNAP